MSALFWRLLEVSYVYIVRVANSLLIFAWTNPFHVSSLTNNSYFGQCVDVHLPCSHVQRDREEAEERGRIRWANCIQCGGYHGSRDWCYWHENGTRKVD